MISGATYSGVPQKVQVFFPNPIFLAKPKSTCVHAWADMLERYSPCQSTRGSVWDEYSRVWRILCDPGWDSPALNPGKWFLWNAGKRRPLPHRRCKTASWSLQMILCEWHDVKKLFLLFLICFFHHPSQPSSTCLEEWSKVLLPDKPPSTCTDICCLWRSCTICRTTALCLCLCHLTFDLMSGGVRWYLTMKSEWASCMICFSERMCSCCRVSTMWRFFRIFIANVLVSSLLSCTCENQIGEKTKNAGKR